MKIINFDLDGTLVDFYGVDGWLSDLLNENVRPYREAKPLVNLSLLARLLHKLQAKGYEINVISWTSKQSTPDFHMAVIEAKMAWLAKHLPSVDWNHVYIVPYGTPKQTIAQGILFDDEEGNRNAWGTGALSEENLIEELKKFLY